MLPRVAVSAVVVIDDRAGRPDPLTPLGAEPMVVWAVRCLLATGLAERVFVLAAAHRADSVRDACRGLPVDVCAGLALNPNWTHAGQRAGGAPGDGVIASPSGEIVLLHDAARPLAPPELALAVVDAVRAGAAAAVPVLPLTDTVKQVDHTGLLLSSPDRSTLRVVQTPQAIRRELLAGPVLESALRLAGSGASVRAVPGDPRAFAVHTEWDLELARLGLGEVPDAGRPRD